MTKGFFRLWLVLAACLPVWAGYARGDGQFGVVVSILPQKFLVERIGGDRVRVSVFVGPGQSPATFEPKPRQMAELAEARLFYRVGVPFEEAWMDAIKAVNPEIEVLDAREGISLLPMVSTEEAGEEGHDHGTGMDPHIWLSPARFAVMAMRLRDRLAGLDPDHGGIYHANCDALLGELERLDQEIRSRLSHAEHREFLVFHPSWGYFASDYGLRQIPIETAGKEPGGRALAHLIEEARALKIDRVFVQRQFSQMQAKSVARTIGAELVVVDPLAVDYLDNLRRVAAEIAGNRRER